MQLDPPSLHGSANMHPVAAPLDAAAVARLNTQLRHHSATDVVRAAMAHIDRLTLVSSFGADSVVLLHIAAMIDRNLPVLFIDTQMLFTETLVYQHELAERLGLRRITIVRAQDIGAIDPDNRLHQRDPDACCAARKAAPLNSALTGFDGWITGRKRFQSGTRAALEFFEVDAAPGRAVPRVKVNPLAYWRASDVDDYITENRLPRHPLVAKGYASIGCAPCTSPVRPGEDPRAGRWRDRSKQECGIHFVQGKMVRAGEKT